MFLCLISCENDSGGVCSPPMRQSCAMLWQLLSPLTISHPASASLVATASALTSMSMVSPRTTRAHHGRWVASHTCTSVI